MALSRAKDYKGNPDDVSFIGPVYKWVLATPSDTVDDPAGTSRGLYIDTAGAVKFKDGVGNTVGALVGLAIGVIHPVQVSRVFSTGTTVTATDIWLLY